MSVLPKRRHGNANLEKDKAHVQFFAEAVFKKLVHEKIKSFKCFTHNPRADNTSSQSICCYNKEQFSLEWPVI